MQKAFVGEDLLYLERLVERVEDLKLWLDCQPHGNLDIKKRLRIVGIWHTFALNLDQKSANGRFNDESSKRNTLVSCQEEHRKRCALSRPHSLPNDMIRH